MLNRLIVVEIVALLLVGAFGTVVYWRQPADEVVASPPVPAVERGDPAPAVLRLAPERTAPPAALVRSPIAGPAAPPSAERPRAALLEPRIVVEKSRRRLTLYDGGRLVRMYRVIVGGRGGDKLRKGDRRTPEGTFYVCVRNPGSQYTLSLGLSYPSIEDAERGLLSRLITRKQYRHVVWCIRNGKRPPWKTRLGGAIMIHGKAEGRASTAGCIAMSDPDIKQLYPLIPIGTPVTIRP